MQNTLIYGTGSTAEIIYEYFLRSKSHKIIGFIENQEFYDDKNPLFKGLPVYCETFLSTYFNPKDIKLFIAVSFSKLNSVRTNIYLGLKAKGWEFTSLIDDRSSVGKNVTIGENTIVMDENTIQDYTIIGNNNIIWSGNHIGHHGSIKDNNFISSHVVIAGNCTIGSNNFFGVNCTIGDGVIIENFNWFSPCVCILKNVTSENLYKAPKPELHSKSSLHFFKLNEN